MYRKTKQSSGNGESVPRDSPTKMSSQSRSKEKPNLRPKTQHREDIPALQPDLLIKTPPEQNLSRQGTIDEGANTNPTHKERPAIENHKVPDTHHYIPPVLETKGEGEGGGATERGGESGPSAERADERTQSPLQEEKSDQPKDELINLLQSISVFFHLSQGRIEELTSLLAKFQAHHSRWK